MRILVAFDEAYRAYGEFIDAAIRRRRRAQTDAPLEDVQVERTVGPGALEEAMRRSEFHLVICGSLVVPDNNPIDAMPAAWIELSVDPQRPSRFRLGEQRWETLNPSLEELVSVVDLLLVAEEVHKRDSSYEEFPKRWERFMEAERNSLLDRVHGRLARALGRALDGENQEEIDRMADEDRRLADEALVRLMGEDGETSYKRLDQLTPQDAPARIRAERAMLDWLIARTEERSWKRSTTTSEPPGS